MSTEAGPTAPSQTAPTCYRHPDRETYIRCSRCERPICPDCMVSAAVGFQCPECVRAGNQGVREARTAFGGRLSPDPGYVSKVLIGLNVAIFLAQTALGRVFESRLFLVGLTHGFPDLGFQGVAAGEWYRLVTAAFLHGGLLHLALNMYGLYLFGPPLEAALGRARFLALYLVSALGGSAASFAFNRPGQVSVGASGAIFGLFAAWFVVSRRLGRDVRQLWVLLAINVVLGFVVPNVDWRAHLGGFLAGGALTLALVYAPRSRRASVQALGCLAVLLASLGIVLARTAQLTDAPPSTVAGCVARAPLDPGQDFVTCLDR